MEQESEGVEQESGDRDSGGRAGIDGDRVRDAGHFPAPIRRRL